jgi:TPR repeat protein
VCVRVCVCLCTPMTASPHCTYFQLLCGVAGLTVFLFLSPSGPDPLSRSLCFLLRSVRLAQPDLARPVTRMPLGRMVATLQIVFLSDEGDPQQVRELCQNWDNGPAIVKFARELYTIQPERAFQLFTRAVALRDADAHGELVWCMIHGHGTRTPLDAAAAYTLADAGHRLGSVVATSALAHCLLFGLGRPRDPSRALLLLEAAVAQDEPRAMTVLGKALLANESSAPSEWDRAIGLFHKAMHCGDAPAAFELGECCRYDKGHVEHNPAQALVYYELAASKKYGPGFYALGQCWETGLGTAQPDPVKASAWFTKGAHVGHAACANALGVCFENGDGVSYHPDRAVECYRFAASLGNSEAAFNLAVSYEQGDNGLEPHQRLADALYQRATETNSHDADP